MLSLNHHYALSRLEYSYCWQALSMDRRRFRNRDRAQELGGGRFLTLDSFFDVHFLWGHRGCCCWRGALWYQDFAAWVNSSCPVSPIYPSESCLLVSCHHCSHHPVSCVSLQALAQELNFSAYLGLPVFMMPLKGAHNANLARLLLNHIHTGHHTSNVRHAALKKTTQHTHVDCS